MDNPIKYNDLFGSDIETGLNGLLTQLGEVKKELLEMMNESKTAAQALSKALGAEPSKDALAGAEALAEAYKKQKAQLESVTAEYEKLKATKTSTDLVAESAKKLGASMDNLANRMGGVKAETKKTNEAEKNLAANLKTLGIAYESVSKNVVKLVGIERELALSEKDLANINKAAKDYRAEAADAYTQLSKRYSGTKVIVNQLTQSERANNATAKEMVTNTREWYEQMNELQQATGRHQLQVGQYTKAFNGLNLATQQVVRELPVMAFGLDRFVMAISNNLPIWGDAIKKAIEMNEALREQKKAMLASGDAAQIMEANQMKIVPVFKQVIKSLLSWQTVMLAILTVLPAIIKNIRDKKKALEEQNGVLKESVDLESTFYKVQKTTHTGYVEEATKLHVLYNATMDTNRGRTEQLKLAEVLIKQFPEIFKGYSAEAIVLGKAKDVYDKFTETLHKQAKARAILSIATDNEKKRIELLMEKEKLLDEGNTKKRVELLENERKKLESQKAELEKEKGKKDSQRDRDRESIMNREIRQTEDRIAVLEEELGVYIEIDNKLKDITESNEWLTKQVRSKDFLELPDQKEKGRGRQAAQKTEKEKEHKDYFYTAWESEIATMEDGLDKEYALAEIAYEKEMDALREHLTEFYGESEEYREKNAEQETYILEAMANAEQEYYNKISKIQRDYNEKKPKMKVYIPKFEGIKEDLPEYKEPEKKSFLAKVFGFKDEKDFRKYIKGLERVFNLTFKYMQEWIDKRIEMAHIAVELAEKEANSAKEALDLEQQARVNGYAHNVGLARKEYEEKLKAKQKAMDEEQRLAKVQQKIDTAQQVSSMLVATANLWANYSKMPLVGVVLAGIATAAMFSAFAAAQVQAAQLANTKKYGDGMSEYLDYGGSHASGNDIDFGTMKDGTRRRVERGEMVAVINKRNVNKYGVDNIAAIMSSLNTGTFEDKYGLAFAGMSLASASTDLTKVEEGIGTLVRQGEKRVVQGNGYRVEYFKNRKRIIRN